MTVPTTNLAHRALSRRITFGTFEQPDARGRTRLYAGYRFACHRCPYVSRVLRHRVGAEYWGTRHDGECEALRPGPQT